MRRFPGAHLYSFGPTIKSQQKSQYSVFQIIPRGVNQRSFPQLFLLVADCYVDQCSARVPGAGGVEID